jgi:hypothetical protein
MELLDNLLDRSGEEIAVYYDDRLGMSKAFGLFLITYGELVENEMNIPIVTWNNSNKVVYAVKGDKIVSGICWEVQEHTKMAWIILSFTDRNHRRLGINKILNTYFEKKAKGQGAQTAGGFVHVNNLERIQGAAELGMNPQFYRMYKKIR